MVLFLWQYSNRPEQPKSEWQLPDPKKWLKEMRVLQCRHPLHGVLYCVTVKASMLQWLASQNHLPERYKITIWYKYFWGKLHIKEIKADLILTQKTNSKIKYSTQLNLWPEHWWTDLKSTVQWSRSLNWTDLAHF